MTFKCTRCQADVSYEGDYPTCPECGLVYSMVVPGEHTPPWATLDKQPEWMRKQYEH